MTVTPVPAEPGRFMVSSETDNLPWLVDLAAMPDEPRCACAISHNRTPDHWHCKHIKAAQDFVRAHRLT